LKYLLDTNACIDYLTGRYASVVARIRQASPEDLFLSCVAVAELRYGAEKSAHRRRNHARIDLLESEIRCVDFDLAAAATYGTLRAPCWKVAGNPSGPTTS